jgi:hypothetical protein
MPGHRAADVLYNSEAALRLIVSELGELRRRSTPRSTPRGRLVCDEEDLSAPAGDGPGGAGAEPGVLDRP